MTISHITPALYQDSPEHRAVCDAVMARAGLSSKVVADVERIDGNWKITRYLLDDDGKRYLLPDSNEFAMEVVQVAPPWSDPLLDGEPVT